MKQTHLHDQRGAAMFLELLLVAAVLGLVGVAIYQANHRSTPAASLTSTPSPAPNSATGLANAAAATVITDSAADSALSASAEDTAGEVTGADTDAANLGDTLNADSF